MSFFDNSHVTDVQWEGYNGPAPSFLDQIKQGWEQQFRVDSQQGLQQEIDNLWRENLELLGERTGQRFTPPDRISSYTSYHDKINGVSEEQGSMWFRSLGEAPEFIEPEWKRIEDAEAAIRNLGDPSIKTFEQIVQEVFALQQETEERSGRMAQAGGAGGTVGQFIGAAGGSFTGRDPLNLGTLPIGGVGRTIATRIATEMAVGGAVVAATEVGFVQENRARAGLPERSLAFDVAAGAVGAGVFRGLFEGAGAAYRGLPSTQRAAAIRELEQAEFNQRDIALQALLETMPQSPRARAGLSLLDDAQALEAANPYGSGPTAEARFYAELQETARALGGQTMTAVARVLPPIPSEYIDKAIDFKIVKEQAPEIWAQLEAAQTRLADLNEGISTATARIEDATIVDAVRLVDEDAAAQLEALAVRVNDEASPEPVRAAAEIEAQAIINRVGPERIEQALSGSEQRTRRDIRQMRSQRAKANQQYQAAYKAVEAEAEKLNRIQAVLSGKQQADSVDLLGYPTAQKPFIGPLTRHDAVGARVAHINEANEQIADRAEHVAKAVVDEETGLVDIGLKTPIPKDFRVPFDDGEMTVEKILDDFVEDDLLDEAMRTCLI